LFLAEIAALKQQGVKSSTAYEILAHSYGFNTYSAFLADRRKGAKP
jgi:hypothetical protein